MGEKKGEEGSKPEPPKKLPKASSSKPEISDKKTEGDLKKTSEDFFIVGIGASAGGLDAMENFFKNMPQESGMAFVIITHLSPNQESILPELIKKHTPLQVFPAEEGMKVRTDCIYVIPPGNLLSIQDHTLHIKKTASFRHPHLPIDFFFRSLAQDSENRAIGVILSGSGTDGTQGLKTIKLKLGIVVSQDPESAEYSAMPRSAIKTGLVDFVLPVQAIPEKLVRYVRNAKEIEKKETSDIEDIGGALDKIILIIRNQTGHDFSFYKKNTICRRIERRMNINHIYNVRKYTSCLRQNPYETDLLFKDLLIGVTHFFRDAEAFDLLKKSVIPRILKNKSISVLFIDDSDDRTDHIVYRLRRAGYEPLAERVNTAKTLKSALSGQKWHMILLINPDIRNLSPSKALRILEESDCPMPPLMLVPRTSCQKSANDQGLWAGILHLLTACDHDSRDAMSDLFFNSLKHTNESLRQVIKSRRIIEKRVKESEDRFRALILNAYDLIISTEADGTISYVSPSSEILLGFPPEYFLRTNLFKHFHPVDAERAQKQRYDFIKKYGHSIEVEFRIKHANGTWVCFQGIVTNLLNRSSVRAVVINARDITYQKKRDNEREKLLSRLQELMTATEEKAYKLKAVIDFLPLPLFIYGTDNRISLANEASIAALGFDPTGMDQLCILKSVTSRLPTGEKTHLDDAVSYRALKGETVKDRQYLFLAPSGDERMALCSAFPIRFRGEIINAVVLWGDITERERLNQSLKKARDDLEVKVFQRTAELVETINLLKEEIRIRQAVEKQLQSSNELMQKIFSNEHILIAYMDTGFNFVKVNEAYARADGHKPEFYSGRNHFRLFPNEENERIFRRVVRTGKPYTVYAKPFKYLKNSERGFTYWDWSLQPFKNESGMVEGIILFLVNVTKRVEAEKNMTRMQTEMIRSEHLYEIGKLASTMAHELRNPLAVIETACFNISHKNRNPALNRNLESIEQSLEESNQIINNLLFYARRRLPSYEMFSICDLLGECIEQAKKRYRASKVRIKKKCTIPKDIRMEADPLQMKELFGNILNNALDALGKEEGKISVSVALENNLSIRFLFKDNGKGIRKEDLEKVQNPFFSTKSKGTGLGLAVCSQIVDLHDGRIKIKSKEGEGTTVILTLPLKKGI